MSDVNWYDGQKSCHRPSNERTRFKGAASYKKDGKKEGREGRITKADKEMETAAHVPGLIEMGDDDDESLQSLLGC
jgi:hypothetical protein